MSRYPSILASLGEAVLAGQDLTPGHLALLEGSFSGGPADVHRALKLLGWARSRGHPVGSEWMEAADRAVTRLLGGPAQSSDDVDRCVARWLALAPQERPPAGRLETLLGLLRRWGPRGSPNDPYPLHGQAARVLLRLDLGFDLLDGEDRATVRDMAGSDPQVRWCAVVRHAGLRVAPARLAQLQRVAAGEEIITGPPEVPLPAFFRNEPFRVPSAESMPRCPCCRRGDLTWFRELSPPWTWENLCGFDVLRWVCEMCRVEVENRVLCCN